MDYLSVMTLLPEPADIAERWLEVVRRYGVQGKAVHNARLVAFALTHGVSRILTLNPDDFRRYTEVTAVTPAKLLEELNGGG